MAHHIYQTEGYVLKTVPSGEANLSVRVYTRELGLIRATAQGVRVQKSKLRYSLQEYSRGWFAFVRGKEIWRVTNARSDWNAFYAYHDRPEFVSSMARILSLVDRLAAGEERNEGLYDTLDQLFAFFNEHASSDYSADSLEIIQNAEYIGVLKLLHYLGYGPEKETLQPFVEKQFDSDLIEKMSQARPEAITFIRQSLQETQL